MFACNDAPARYAQEGCRRVGLRIPKDVTILGVVVQESTTMIAIAGSGSRQRCHVHRTRVGDGARVADVARIVDLSDSTLDNRFNEILGSTAYDEIERVRMERTNDLLSGTDCKPAKIPKQAGFGTVQYLATVFRQATGQTPGEYCKANSW